MPSQRPWWGAHRPGPEDRQTWTRLQSSSVCNLPLGSLLGPPCCPANAPRVGGLPCRAVLWLHTTHHREEITPKPLSSASGTSSLSCGKTSVAEDCLRKSVTFQLPFLPKGKASCGRLWPAAGCSWATWADRLWPPLSVPLAITGADTLSRGLRLPSAQPLSPMHPVFPPLPSLHSPAWLQQLREPPPCSGSWGGVGRVWATHGHCSRGEGLI